jgi:PAT family beta-lactamase induction signal transducer AmpG
LTARRTPSSLSAEPGLAGPARDRLLFAVLYFSEGVPIGFLWWALPSVLREQSMDVGRITSLTAALTVPWTLKFLAGPVVDRSVARGGRLRNWILACQVAMGLSLLPLAGAADVPVFPLLLGFLLAHACFAAVQDVAIDALCIRTVPAGNIGSVNGWMQFGMTVGRAAAAAAVPLLIHAVGWRAAIGLVVALIWAPMLFVVLMVREPPPSLGAPDEPRSTLMHMLSWALLPAAVVALLAGTGFEASGALAGPLLVDLGFDAGTRALFFGAIAPAGLAVGGLVAARLADGLGLVRAVGLAVVVTAAAVASLATSVAGVPVPAGRTLHTVLFGLVYLSAGFLISTSYAMFMNVARGRWRATRFSLLMALTNACETGSGFLGGRLVMSLGYGGALGAMAALSLLSLPVLRCVRPNGVRTHAGA